VNNRATDAGRGQDQSWPIETIIDQGYGLIAATYNEIEEDYNGGKGIRTLYEKAYPGKYSWGAIAAWGWTLSRIVDYLVTDLDVDSSRIAAVGHSRLGKTAIYASVFDERFSLVIPSQSGTGGAAPSRSVPDCQCETVKDINTEFPYWFSPVFHQFNEQVTKLPFDQHSFISLVAPRPILLDGAVEDLWGNPSGVFQMEVAANPVYLLLNTPGISTTSMPPVNTLVSSILGYVIRPGKHSMTPLDWGYYLEYADIYFKK